VERVEAEAIVDGDRETVIGLLLRLDDLVVANGRLVEANERLEGRVAELERRLNRSSRNSSLPPSQDPPSAPPRPGEKGSGRKRGGQHGHEGKYRRLLPPERVDEVVEHWPEQCRSCAHEFVETERVDAVEPSRRQVAELPPTAARVTEHRLHRVCCPECAALTTAEPPVESRWAFGPRLQAAVVTLAVRNRVSRRDTTELARELFGVELSTGSVDAIVQRTGEALAAPHTRLEQEIRQASVVNIDETGWKTGGNRRMLWGALTRRTAVFRIAAGRHATEAQSMLGERYDGIVCSDRWGAYDYLDPAHRQVCWRTSFATSPPIAKEWANKKTSDAQAWTSPTTCSRLGSSSNKTPIASRSRPASRHSTRSSASSSSTPPARAPRPNTTDSSPATSSNSGRHCGPSPTPKTSNRPTTTPNADSAAP
jgi:Transposase IS66 family/Family of unknown function (DUF6444)